MINYKGVHFGVIHKCLLCIFLLCQIHLINCFLSFEFKFVSVLLQLKVSKIIARSQIIIGK